MTDEKKAWDRMEGESEKAFRGFCIYRNLEDDVSIDIAFRIYRKAEHGQNKRAYAYFFEWAKKFSWVDRRAAYRDYLQKIRDKAIEQKIHEAASEIMEDLIRLSKIEPKSLFDDEGLPIPINEIPADAGRFVKYKFNSRSGVTIELEDREKAREMILRLNGSFEKDNKQKTPEKIKIQVEISGTEEDV